MGTIHDMLQGLACDAASKTTPRPYRNAMVRFRKDFTLEDRIAAAERAGWNAFQFPSEMLNGCDLLSDSGTTTMTAEQWAQLMVGDEAYGSNEGFFMLKDQVAETFGPSWANRDPNANNLFIFHQGRAAEHAIFTMLRRSLQAKHPGATEPWIVPSNAHFDTTGANVEANGMIAMNLFSPLLDDAASTSMFKGNMDVEALERLLSEQGDRVPVIYMTITNNTGGGQAVSMANLKRVAAIAQAAGKPLFFDACRFAENAWFIKTYEDGYAEKTIREITHEAFELADGFTISLKKDGLSNMGGALVLKEGARFLEQFPDARTQFTDHQILVEGHPTYGGLTGRDIKALVEGLRTVTFMPYLEHRIGQVRRFGEALQARHVPVLAPFGGHAVYIKVDDFFAGTKLERQDFGGVSLVGLLLPLGHRLCELGAFAFGSYADGQHHFENVKNFVRCAVPRLMFEDVDLIALADLLGMLYEQRDRIPGVEVTYGLELTLRHFKARFRFKA